MASLKAAKWKKGVWIERGFSELQPSQLYTPAMSERQQNGVAFSSFEWTFLVGYWRELREYKGCKNTELNVTIYILIQCTGYSSANTDMSCECKYKRRGVEKVVHFVVELWPSEQLPAGSGH